LTVNGSLLSSGAVSVAGSATLSGAGSVGNVAVGVGGIVAPGLSGAGTLTMTACTLGSNDGLIYTLGTDTGSNGLLTVTGASGLTLNTGLTLNVTSGGHLTSGTYALANVTGGTITDNSSNFSGWTVPVTSSYYPGTSFLFSKINGNKQLIVTVTAPAFNVAWSGTSGGNWDTAANWQYQSIPTNSGDSATFGNAIGSTTATITMNGSRTLSGLTFSPATGGSYLITGTDTLTLSSTSIASTASLSLNMYGGSHTIAVPIVLGNNLAIANNVSGSQLTISGPISDNSSGKNLTLGGTGTLILTGTNTYGGHTTSTIPPPSR